MRSVVALLAVLLSGCATPQMCEDAKSEQFRQMLTRARQQYQIQLDILEMQRQRDHVTEAWALYLAEDL